MDLRDSNFDSNELSSGFLTGTTSAIFSSFGLMKSNTDIFCCHFCIPLLYEYKFKEIG